MRLASAAVGRPVRRTARPSGTPTDETHYTPNPERDEREEDGPADDGARGEEERETGADAHADLRIRCNQCNQGTFTRLMPWCDIVFTMQASNTIGQIDALKHHQPKHHEAIEHSTTACEASGNRVACLS